MPKKQFRYTPRTNAQGETSLIPYLPLTLIYNNYSLNTGGLLDTGASVNVLPYEIGLELGLDWDANHASVELTGNLAQFVAKGVILLAHVEEFNPVALVFAWTQAQNIPLILGRVNFFQEFDVCFYGSHSMFDVTTKSLRSPLPLN